MKLLRYGERGHERPGLLDADGRIRDLSAVVADIAGDALAPQGLAALRAIDPARLPVVEGDPRIGACVGGVGKFVCIGLNYADHAAESGMALPAEPVVFNKWTSAICGPDDDIEIPDAGYSFRTLKNAQAQGDYETLKAHNLPVTRIVLSGDPAKAVRDLIKEI